jgi:hypothetical protein
MQCMEWRHSTEQTGQQVPSSGLGFDNHPLVTVPGAHMAPAPQAGDPLVGTASRIHPLLQGGQTFAQAPMGGELYPYEIDCRELPRTNFYGTCVMKGDPYQQYNMGPGMEFALPENQERYALTGIAPSMLTGMEHTSFHNHQTETWPAQFSPPASCFPPTLSERYTLQSHSNAKIPIPRMPNHHPWKQDSAFILTPLQSTLHQ